MSSTMLRYDQTDLATLDQVTNLRLLSRQPCLACLHLYKGQRVNLSTSRETVKDNKIDGLEEGPTIGTYWESRQRWQDILQHHTHSRMRGRDPRLLSSRHPLALRSARCSFNPAYCEARYACAYFGRRFVASNKRASARRKSSPQLGHVTNRFRCSRSCSRMSIVSPSVNQVCDAQPDV